ncbi:MAG: hypothetical protein ACRCUC_07150 [Aestuariivirga sp.]
MSGPTQFLTVAGRWANHRAILERAGMQREQLTFAMMCFYAGFAAALEAGLEIADEPEDSALVLLGALHDEVKSFEAMASKLAAGASVN